MFGIDGKYLTSHPKEKSILLKFVNLSTILFPRLQFRVVIMTNGRPVIIFSNFVLQLD